MSFVQSVTRLNDGIRNFCAEMKWVEHAYFDLDLGPYWP